MISISNDFLNASARLRKPFDGREWPRTRYLCLMEAARLLAISNWLGEKTSLFDFCYRVIYLVKGSGYLSQWVRARHAAELHNLLEGRLLYRASLSLARER